MRSENKILLKVAVIALLLSLSVRKVLKVVNTFLLFTKYSRIF